MDVWYAVLIRRFVFQNPDKISPFFFNIIAFYIQIRLIFAMLFAPKLEWAEGGRQTYIEGVESASYLRHTESRKFKPPHDKAMF